MAEANRNDEIQGPIVHVYDDIEEADNRLPLWWLWTFYGSIAFAIGYWFYYHSLEIGPSLMQEYATALAETVAPYEPLPEEQAAALADDAAKVSAGQTIFAAQCAACHEARGEGKIGPNLTDPFWIHGGSASDIHRTIYEGVLSKGMPGWGTSLGRESVDNVTAFVLSIRGTNVEGKEPQGDRYPAEGAGGDAAGAEDAPEGAPADAPAADGGAPEAEGATANEAEAAEAEAEGDAPDGE